MFTSFNYAGNLNAVKNLIIAAITYSLSSNSSPSAVEVVNALETIKDMAGDASVEKENVEYYDYPACCKALNLPLGSLYVLCGENNGWGCLINCLLSSSSIVAVYEKGSTGFTSSSAIMFSYNGYLFLLNVIDGIPAIIASKQFFDYTLIE